MDDILSDDWNAFIEVGLARSFSRAAINMRTHQPVLSRRIARLEESLGTRLLERTNRGVRLTPAGQRIFDSLIEGREQMKNAVLNQLKAADDLKGLYRIGCHRNVGIAYLNRFVPELLRHPELQLQFEFADSRRVVESIQHGHLDYGIAVNPNASSDLVIKKIAAEPFGVFERASGAKKEIKTVFYNPEFVMLGRIRSFIQKNRSIAIADYDIIASLAATTAESVGVLPLTVAERWKLRTREEIPGSTGDVCLVYRSTLKGTRLTRAILEAALSR